MNNFEISLMKNDEVICTVESMAVAHGEEKRLAAYVEQFKKSGSIKEEANG